MNEPDDGIPATNPQDPRVTGSIGENARFQGQPGPWAPVIGSTSLTLGAGMELEDFFPASRLEAPTDPSSLAYELGKGLHKLYGTPLLHHSQQMLAIQYGHSKSFGGSSVTFKCHWSYYEPGTVTVRGENLIQEVTSERS